MDVLYEESAVNARAKKREKIYKIVNVFSVIFGVLTAIFAMLVLFSLIGMIGAKGEAKSFSISYAVSMLFPALFFGGLFAYTYFLKRRLNVSYDYTFVSGELRIARVYNTNKRKFLYRIDAEEMMQIGDVDSEGFDRLVQKDPSMKRIVCTPNDTPMEGKFFLYLQVANSYGRNLYILECREEMLVQILHFAKRGTLASDYVEQSKKQ